MKSKLLLLLPCLILPLAPAHAFRYDDAKWPNGSVVMVLSLGDTKKQSDGLTFNESAADALNTWNQYMVRMQFAPVVDPTDSHADGDHKTSVFFASDIYGEQFDSTTLAVTLRNYSGGKFDTLTEADVIFNTKNQFDSYRGNLRGPVYDLHRIALHEFGHVLGLDHPDESGQTLTAIMNAHVSNLDALAKDDITGAKWIYGDPNPAPAPTPGHANNLVNLSTRGYVNIGDEALIGGFILQGPQPARVMLRAIGPSLESRGVAGFQQDPQMELHNANGGVLFSNDDWTGSDNAQEIIDTGLAPETQYDSVIFATLPAGSYTAVVTAVPDAEGIIHPGVGLFELYDFQSVSTRAGNISTRGKVQTGDGVMIGGVIVGGDQSKQVVVRGIGPSLTGSGVAGALQDPTMELHDSSGALIASNDNWGDGPDAATIQSRNLAPTDPRESALLSTLNPSNYTVILRGANNTTGVALVEVYDLAPAP